jgi:hypothetical protein
MRLSENEVFEHREEYDAKHHHEGKAIENE